MALRTLKGIKELRLILCQKSQNSQGLRTYIAANYEAIRLSPARITIRQCQGSQPTAIATYSYGIQKKATLKKMNTQQIDKTIKQLQALSETIAKQIRI